MQTPQTVFPPCFQRRKVTLSASWRWVTGLLVSSTQAVPTWATPGARHQSPTWGLGRDVWAGAARPGAEGGSCSMLSGGLACGRRPRNTAAPRAASSHVHAALSCAVMLRPGDPWGESCHPPSPAHTQGPAGESREGGPWSREPAFHPPLHPGLGAAQPSSPGRRRGHPLPPTASQGWGPGALCPSVWSHSASAGRRAGLRVGRGWLPPEAEPSVRRPF